MNFQVFCHGVSLNFATSLVHDRLQQGPYWLYAVVEVAGCDGFASVLPRSECKFCYVFGP